MRPPIDRCFTQLFDAKPQERRWHRAHRTELFWMFRLTVSSGLSWRPTPRQGRELVAFEVFKGEQPDVIGLGQLPGALGKLCCVTQHRHGSGAKSKQTQPDDVTLFDYVGVPIFAFGDDEIIRSVAKLFAAGGDIGLQGDDVFSTLGDVAPTFECLGQPFFEPLAVSLPSARGCVSVRVCMVVEVSVVVVVVARVTHCGASQLGVGFRRRATTTGGRQ
mgnify:CR=1 FL=1